MNKIILDNKKKIILDNSGDYYIEYSDSVNDVNIIIDANIEVILNVFCCDKVISNNIRLSLSDNAKLVVNKFYNNIEVNEDINIDLDGKMSSIVYNFSNISLGLESYKININHNNRDVSSIINNRVIAFDGAGVEFIIDSNVEKGNSGAIMDQKTKIINLGDNKSVIKPNMNIHEYDVKATHGAVIGKFRYDDIFYCMSRGISYNDALNLLIKGFLLFGKDINLEYREYVNSVIDMYWR